MYVFLDKFFFVFHSMLVLFIVFGWIWRKSRKAHFVVSILTAFSWFFIGIWYGFGFCPLTEWHYQVRMKLGHYDMSSSYLKFLFDSLTGWDINRTLLDVIAVSFLILALYASILLNLKDWKNRKIEKK
ncbi:MAG: DUF2784 family protein [Candidatus Aminicenantes bacterium]|nr:DUF2784 family protein [Candidatus Aminicenantes bacterium]